MKNHFTSLLFCLFAGNLISQNGLEKIIVEKYYISNLNDANLNATYGALAAGSTAYRVYVDMKPGYKLQAVYGNPDHELNVKTTTYFFNNEDRGAVVPTFTKTQASKNTVLLDSYISVGAACSGNFGVLKSADNGLNNIVNADGILKNNDPKAGIPLTTQDGLLAGTPEVVTRVGIDNLLSIFDNANGSGNGETFSTTNGSWAALNGAIGPIADSNQVLIGQFTTNGIFSFQLNLQIGTPTGGVERYVAKNPVSGNQEILFPQLSYISDSPTSLKYINTEKELFSIYPTPAEDFLNVHLNDEVKGSFRIAVYNMQGGLEYIRTYSPFSTIPDSNLSISHLASGYYLLEVITEGKRDSRKFLKR